MGRTRVLRRELERPEGPRLARLKPEAERSDDVAPVAREVLRLQRSGGNGAVESMLAQRDGPTQTDGGGKDDAVSATLVVDDPIGVLPLISFSRASERDTNVVIPSSSKDSVLMEACAKGKPIGTVKISTGSGLNITLEDVFISGCQQGGGGGDRPVLNLTLNTPEPEKKKKR